MVIAAAATVAQTNTSLPHNMRSHLSNKTTTHANNLQVTFFGSRDPGDLWWELAGVATKQGKLALVVQDIVVETTIMCRNKFLGHIYFRFNICNICEC